MKVIITGVLVLVVGWLSAANEDKQGEKGGQAYLFGKGNVNESGTTAAYSDYGEGLVGGKHDFSDQRADWDNACKACHIPHVQAIRPTTQPSTQPAYEMYRIGGQRRVFEPDRYMPGPTSLICLGCHDGTVATSAIGSSHALLAGIREGFAVPDSFVWRDHPIGVPYPRNDRKYRPLSFVLAKGRISLPEGRIECVSCHDPHNSAGVDNMLVMSNRRSALCLGCHVK
ncbi:MAG: cytochrome c3 family protein [Planctomycetota bacterium]|jgi:predicted CXXCH cytochrome family protein